MRRILIAVAAVMTMLAPLTPARAEGPAPSAAGKLIPVLIRLDGEPLATYRGSVRGFAATSPYALGTIGLDLDSTPARRYAGLLAQQRDTLRRAIEVASPRSTVIREFATVFNGMAALVPASDLRRLARLPGVASVTPDVLVHPDTDVSPQFIGAESAWIRTGGVDAAGEGIVVGVIDTGIWPEHPSFADPDPAGDPYPAPPVSWTGTACDFGNTAVNPDDAPFTCNNKLIGASAHIATYKSVIGLDPGEFDSTRDDDGHGTHTASTAAGNSAVSASILGAPFGTISGVAPRAHVAAYRACAKDGCFSSDLVAAIEQAVADGVDVINYSIGGGSSPYTDAAEQALLAASEAGVVIAASGGNTGPAPNTVGHRGPWTITVGATSTPREFTSTLIVAGTVTGSGEPAETELVGTSATPGIETPTPIVLAADFGYTRCDSQFPPGTFNGEIVVCQRGVNARVEKSFNVAAGGAGGMILYNPTTQGTEIDNHHVPSVHLEAGAGSALLAFLAAHDDVTATFTAGSPTPRVPDVLAEFSSRGGDALELATLKPDLTAPGAQILAGHSAAPATPEGGPPGEQFQVLSGTSMSAPHVAGAAALLRQLHPGWTAAQIRSALMLSATPDVTDHLGNPTGVFARGSGRIQLDLAARIGLTLNEDPENYTLLADSLFDLNQASLFVPEVPGQFTVTRTVHNETAVPVRYRIVTEAPGDVDLIAPSSIVVPAGGSTSFPISIDARYVPIGGVREAVLSLRRGSERLTFPIAFIRTEAPITLDKACSPATVPVGGTTECTITMVNTSGIDASAAGFDIVPPQLQLLPGSVAGAEQFGDTVVWEVVLDAEAPPQVVASVVSNASPFGYTPLASIGAGAIAPCTNPTVNQACQLTLSDEDIINLNTGFTFEYGGKSYSRVGVTDNGYAIVGGGTAGDVDFINAPMPDPARPNNLLAPYWTDLDPAAGGRILTVLIDDGSGANWLGVEWESVPNWGCADGAGACTDPDQLNTFQLWIGGGTANGIFFTYSSELSGGEGIGFGDYGALTVGAENEFGTTGNAVYYADPFLDPPVTPQGTLPTPSPGFEVEVTSTPPGPGGSHTVTYQARGVDVGAWENTAIMFSEVFRGNATSVFTGEVTE